MSFSGTERPKSLWHHASTHLDDFVIISYRVDTEKLRSHLPEGIEPSVFTFSDGTTGSLVSAVLFLDRDFAFRFMPLIRLSCGQVNYRAYVNVNGEDGVWFFGTSLDSKLVMIPQRLWKMPWHRDIIKITTTDSTWKMESQGNWGGASVSLTATGNVLSCLDGFTDVDETICILTHPMAGWFMRTDNKVGKYTVWHEVFDLLPMEVNHAHFDVFERLGLVDSSTAVHSALMQKTIHFDVHTPPKRYGGHGGS